MGILTRTETRPARISYKGKACCNTKDRVKTSSVTHPVSAQTQSELFLWHVLIHECECSNIIFSLHISRQFCQEQKVCEVVPVHAGKANRVMVVQVHSSLISVLDGGEWSTWRPAALRPGKDAPGTSDKRLGRPQCHSGRFAVRKYLLSLPEIELRFLGRPSRSLATIMAELLFLRICMTVSHVSKEAYHYHKLM